MPIEVEDVGEEEATKVGEDTTESPEPVSNSPVSEAVPERPKTSAKARGRPPGSRNKPKPPPEPVTEEVIEEVIVKKNNPPRKLYTSLKAKKRRRHRQAPALNAETNGLHTDRSR